ncbi:MAG: hypothetical protein H7Z71_07090 [Moraxellaceae bacterium]|nr:hypothetical protein [Pseudobdellovibrionaceae bacterium]
MKNTLKSFALFILLTPLTSHALIEARLTYGGLGAKDFAANACGALCTSGNIPAVVPLTGTGADVILSLPLIPFGFGVRYEKLGFSASSSNAQLSASIERIAAILNYRIINTILHIGPIATVGISTKTQAKIVENGITRANYDANSAESFSLGLEAGLKPLIVIPISVGAEAGYQYLKIKNATNSVDSSTRDLDLSGGYLKLFLGLDF